jgi:hypothetical protein
MWPETSYNSCRNRHCPKCQSLQQARWVEARKAELLPVGYFHLVFTIPECLNPVALYNKTVVYNLLFQAVAETLKQVAANPKNLGAQIGFIAVLHTWDQRLNLHPHIHCIVPGGRFREGRSGWIRSPENYFLPNPYPLGGLPREVAPGARTRLHRRDVVLLRDVQPIE